MPVLLAAHGLDNETTCHGNTMSVLWSTGAGAQWLQVAQVHGIVVPVQRARIALHLVFGQVARA